MGLPITYQFDLPDRGRPELFTLEQEWYPGVRDFWTDTTSNRNVDAIQGIEAIVIHATAGSSSASAMSVMKAKRASWHWLVPGEDELQHGHFVWACVPEWMAAWHVLDTKSHIDVSAGRNCINQWSLGIEIVNAQAPADTFSDWQMLIAARIVRYCWAKYPNLKHVVSHAKLDPARRADPGSHFDWERFETLIRQGSPCQEELPHPLAASATPVNKLFDPPKGLTICAM